MNQILTIENKKKKQKNPRNATTSSEIKGIVRFFAILIMIFGFVLVGEASYAIYKEADDRNPANLPTVSIGRLNDTVILNVEHSQEISKIIYSWDNGEKTELPQGGLTAKEEILLPNQDSTLNITIEDMKGRQTNYKKQFFLSGMDLIKPTIDINVADGNRKMTIIAKDETAIDYLSYSWEGQDEVVINSETDGQTEIKKEIELTPGTKKIKIKAQDMNGNIESIEKEIVATTSEPKMQVLRTGNKIIIEASDDDGIKDITVNINGKKYATKELNLKYVQVGPVELQEGNNTILVEVTNVSGYTKKASTELRHTP